jgi:aspartate aminotransferase
MNNAFAVRKNLVRDLLKEISGMRVNDPKGAFYIFPDISAFFGKTLRGNHIGNATDFCEYLLQEAGVALVAGDAFGAPNCFRISFAASEEDLRKAVHLIKNALTDAP